MWKRKKKKVINDKRYEYETEDGTTIVRRIEGITNKKDLFEMIDKIIREEVEPANERGKHYKVDVVEDKSSVIENKINSFMKDVEAREKLNELLMRCKEVPDEEVMTSIVTVISAYMKANADRIGSYCLLITPKGNYHETDIGVATNFKSTNELKDFIDNAVSLLSEDNDTNSEE